MDSGDNVRNGEEFHFLNTNNTNEGESYHECPHAADDIDISIQDNHLRNTTNHTRCPRGFQSLRWYIFFLCVFFFLEGFVVNGYINVILVALETRFSLSSTLSGFLASCNDIGGILVILPVSYFGEHRHKPRIIFGGILFMALGSLLFAVPHFAAGNYQYKATANPIADMQNMCDVNSTASDVCATSSQSKSSPLYILFVIGQLLLGVGACPAATLGFSYMDENTLPKMTSFYTGLVLSVASVGVAVGYIVGGQSLTIFVDVNTVDANSIGLTPGDPQWVGAWWIGPLIALLAFLLIALPFLAFSKRLPDYHELQRKRKSETHADGAEDITVQAGFGENIRDFPRAVFLLVLRCPPYMLVCCGAVMEALVFGGIATFGAKIIQHRFNADIAVAGLVMGMITVPGAGGGMLLGGYLVKRLNLKCRGILRLCTLSALLSLLLAPAFLASCPRAPLVGVSTHYRDSNEPGLESSCNVGCGCSTSGFEPVCVNSTTVFFSPCYAGCTEFSGGNISKGFTNCSCIIQSPQSQNNTLHPLSEDEESSLITRGGCADTCAWLYVFSLVCFLGMLCTFSTMAPTVSAVFRCVPSKQRSLALGFNLLLVRLLGTTPGPVLLGWILDSCCVVPQEICGSLTGLCWVYATDQMGYRLLVWWILLKLLSVIFYYLASRLYRKPQEVTSSSL